MLTQKEISHYTNYWCKVKGFKSKDLEQHPRADDIVLLVSVREEFWSDMTKGQQRAWEAYWSLSYTNKKKLKAKHLTKLENISISAINTRLFKDIRKAEQRIRIKALRNPTVATQN